jgi:hypothetical protein
LPLRRAPQAGGHAGGKAAKICAFHPLARLLLKERRQGTTLRSFGRHTMAKLENFTFSVGMALSTLLMFATLAPLA